MTVHVVSRVRIHDKEAMARYVAEAPATVEAYGGQYLYRGGEVMALEGSWEHDRMVLLAFPSEERALAWYNSPEYRPLRDLRQDSAEAVILLVG